MSSMLGGVGASLFKNLITIVYKCLRNSVTVTIIKVGLRLSFLTGKWEEKVFRSGGWQICVVCIWSTKQLAFCGASQVSPHVSLFHWYLILLFNIIKSWVFPSFQIQLRCFWFFFVDISRKVTVNPREKFVPISFGTLVCLSLGKNGRSCYRKRPAESSSPKTEHRPLFCKTKQVCGIVVTTHLPHPTPVINRISKYFGS